MTIDNTGNVGVGTTTPGAKLEVAGQVKITGGAPGAGKVLTSDASGLATWTTPSGGLASGTAAGNTPYWDGTSWIVNSNNIFNNGGNVGIGTNIPSNKLDVTGNTSTVVRGYNTITSQDYYGVFGSTNNTPYYGYGVLGLGGFTGVRGLSNLAGTGSRYGIYGEASGGTTNNTGVYGIGSGTGAYGVYSSGNFTCTGTKAATVKTPDGPKELYSQESPENWFEDFGKGTIQNGVAIVTVAPDYEQTVTINATHPMHAFITPNGNMGNWWIEYSGNTFTVHAPAAANGTAFDYRMVAKRKGYEDLRLKKAPGAYTDKFLYPDVNDVPSEYREAWLKLNALKETKK